MADKFGLAVRRFPFFKQTIECVLRGTERRFATESESVALKPPFYRKPWKICVAILLERKPIVSKRLSDIEERFAAYQNALEFEQSVLSDYELKKIKLTKGSKQTKKKSTEAEEQKRLECEQDLRKIEDEEEEIAEELKKLQLGLQNTGPGKEGIHLDTSMHLVVKSADKWLLPETEIKQGESLRQAAERLVSSQSGSPLQALILSNAPSGVYTEGVDPAKRDQSDIQGRKVFYYKAILQPTRKDVPEFGPTSKWLTINEMQKMIAKEHFKQIIKFLS